MCIKPKINHFLFSKSILFSTIEAVGTSLFFLYIFPKLDLVRSLLLMNSISFLPSSFKIFYELTSMQFKSKRYHLIKFIINILASMMQYSVILIVSLGDFNQINYWILPVSLLLVSISVSKDFFYVNLKTITEKINNRYLNNLRICIENTQISRHKIGIVTNLWKIGVTLLIFYMYNQEFMSNFNLLSSKSIYLSGFIIQISSLLVFFFSCSLAFKLRMHRVAFVLPLLLMTPISIILSAVLCDQSIKNKLEINFKDYYLCNASSFTTNPFR